MNLLDMWWEWYQLYIDTLYEWKNITRDLDNIIQNKREINKGQG